MQRRNILTAFTLALLLWGGPLAWPASAHASLVKADPAVGQTLAAAPTQVSLTFDDDLTEIAGQVVNEIQVFNSAKKRVDATNSAVTGATVTVGLSEIPSGTYSVVYRVLSADGHPVSGEYQFKLAKPSAVSPPTPSAVSPPTPSVTPSKSAASATSKSTPMPTSASSSAAPSTARPTPKSSASEPSPNASGSPPTASARAATQLPTQTQMLARATSPAGGSSVLWWLVGLIAAGSLVVGLRAAFSARRR